MYDRPSSSSPGSAGSPPQSFLHGGEVLRHQVNGPTNNTSWMGNASFDMSQRNGTNGGGGGGDFSRAQVLKYHCQHQHQAGGQQPMMASLAAPAGSTMIHPMAPSSAAGGAFAHGHSPGSSTKFPSSSAPSPATNWGATSSMDDPHRYAASCLVLSGWGWSHESACKVPVHTCLVSPSSGGVGRKSPSQGFFFSDLGSWGLASVALCIRIPSRSQTDAIHHVAYCYPHPSSYIPLLPPAGSVRVTVAPSNRRQQCLR